MIRLAVFDLDGTLMGDDRQISSRVQDAIGRAQAQGTTVTLATGRMFGAALPFARQLHVTAPLLTYQGGWIQAPDATEPLYRVPLPARIAERTLALSDEEGWHTVLYADGEVYLRQLHYAPDFYENLIAEDYHMIDNWSAVLAAHTPDKVLFIAQPDEIPGMARRLRDRLGGQAQVFRSHAHFVEVVPLGVDKGTGLAWLADYLNLPQASVMGVGDQENDLPLVRWAGVGVAMGNAAPPLKEIADWIAPPLEEDGAAVALERFILKEGTS